jgi:hypothetical protein
VGVGFVVAGQAAVVHEPAEGAFDDPAAGLDVEAAGGGVALDDFEVDAEVGGVFDGFGLVAVVGPGFGDGGVAIADVGEEVGAGGGVVDAGPSSGPTAGSCSTAAWPATTRPCPPAPKP